MVELKNNMVIHVSSKEENQQFLEMCKELTVEGVQDFYNIYGNFTCYYIDNYYLYYSDVNFFKSEGYNIVEFKDLEK